MIPRALIFDLDGTLADTDPLHFRAFAEAARPHGLDIDEMFYREAIAGHSNAEICARLFPGRSAEEHARFAAGKEAAFRALAVELMPLAGLVDLLDRAERAGLGLGLVTNAPRENVRHMLRALGLERRFGVVVLGDELERAKPDPLPYATAMRRLGVAPHEAMAFEDSPPGVRSAKGAGAFTVGVTTTQPAEVLTAAGADLAVRDFADPRLDGLIWRETGASGAP